MAGKTGNGRGKAGAASGAVAEGTSEAGREPPAGLTKNEMLVWSVLSEANEPLKAYEILDRLKARGVRAPMTVYRALDGLEEKGFIHKLDGLNSFVLCSHEGPHDVQAFLVCEVCSTVQEIDVDAVGAIVAPAARRADFDMHRARVEVRGVCGACECARHSRNSSNH